MKSNGLIYSLLKRPVTVVMITILIIGFGLFSLTNLKITLFPSIDIPIVAVSVNYRSVSPEDMQRIIVEPIENALASLDGVETMDSNIRKGGAFIVMRLKGGTNAMKVELDAREALDRIRNSLPREASPPIVFQFDPERQPIMRLSIEASNRGLDELRNLSSDIVEPLLERIDGVAQADTRGGLQRAIYIELNPEQLAQHRITTAEVEQAISTNNVQIPAGNLAVGRESYSVRAEAIFTSMDDIRNTIIRLENGTIPIRVQDVAEVRDHFVDVNTIVEVNGKNSVTIDIQKQSDANTLDVALAVMETLPLIEQRLPPGVSIQIINNQGQFIENSIRNLAQSAIFALFLVAVILLVFMSSIRVATVVALSIPISMTATFAAMYFTGVSLNIISITGLALAVGLLVDNSIVVLDNIIAKLEKGESLFSAVLNGTNEVKGALMGSTLTTLGVFIPIFFIEGFIGQIARDLALTITYSITFSYFASIILIPVFSSKLLKKDSINQDGYVFRLVSILENGYEKSFRWLIYHKWIMFFVIAGILFGIYYLNANIPKENFPESDSGELIVSVDLPTGTNLVQTAEIMQQITQRLLRDDRVQTVISSIGRSGFRTETNTGNITVTLVPESEREQSTDDIALEFRRSFVFPGARTFVRVNSGNFGPPGGFGGGLGSIRVSLIGPDTQVLQGITTRIEEVMLQDSLVISVDNPFVDEVPEFVYRIDREVLSRIGSSFGEAANSFKTQTRGTLVGQFRSAGREYPIEVRTAERFRQAGLEDLNRIQVTRFEEQSIPVAAVGFFEPVTGLNRIQRRDRETLLDVNIRVSGDASAQRQRIIELFENEIAMPEGYRYAFTGAFRDQQDSARQLFLALLAALALTFMVMAGKFENLRDPFVIMFSIPLAFFGAYLMLYITGTNFSSPAGIGLLILVGIVVNNGIVLIDYINQSTRRAATPAAYVEQFVMATRRRLRPILLTMLTTVFSMLPLAIGFGEGSETWSPLARVVIGGLFFSAIFTLYIVPVLHIGFSSRKRRIIKYSKINFLNR